MATNPSPSTTRPKDLHVLITGAGITGLLVAQGLKQASVPFTIFEGEPSPNHRTREWTLAIHWSRVFLAKLLPPALLARLREAYCDPFYPYDQPAEHMAMYNSKSGELLKKVPVPGMVRVSRRRMRALCAEGIDVRYGKTLVDVVVKDSEGGVEARFEDGEVVVGSLVIGTDGPRSIVRRILLGEEKAASVKSNLSPSQVLVNYDDVEKARHVRSLDPITYMSFNPDGVFCFISVQNVLDPEDPKTWTFQLSMTWKGQTISNLDNDGRLAALKKAAASLVEPFRSAFLWVPEGTQAYSDTGRYWVTVPWDNRNGRITLAGDSAHPMLPYRGQGLNHCICDASHFVDAIAGVHDAAQLPAAVAAYDAEVITRGKDEVESSVENASMLFDWVKLMESPMMKFGAAKTS